MNESVARGALPDCGSCCNMQGKHSCCLPCPSLPPQVIDVHLLVTIAACGAIALGDWAEAAAVAVLFALAEHWERCCTERARDAVQAVLTLRPESGAMARLGGCPLLSSCAC